MNVICGKYDKHGKGPNRECLMNICKLLGIPLFTFSFIIFRDIGIQIIDVLG